MMTISQSAVSSSRGGLRNTRNFEKNELLGAMANAIMLTALIVVPVAISGCAGRDNNSEALDTSESDLDDLFGDSSSDLTSNNAVLGGERVFESLIQPIKEARDERLALGESVKLAIDNSLWAASSGLDATEFAEKVLSLESTYQLFQGGSTHRCWIKEKLTSELIDIDDVSTMFNAYLSSLQLELLDLDRNLLVAAQHGQEYSSSHSIDVAGAIASLDSSIWGVINETETASSYAPLEMAGSMVISTLVGSVTQSAVTGMSDKDSRGEPTTLSQNYANGAGIAAGFASDYVTKEIVGSSRKLKDAVESGLRSGIASIRINGVNANRWTAEIDEYIRDEQECVESLIFQATGVSPSWATEKLR